jgi:hypothetical protein
MTARKTPKPPVKKGTGPMFHQVRISREIRNAASQRRIGAHHVRPLVFRHLRAVGLPDPRGMALDYNIAYVVAAVVGAGGVLEGTQAVSELWDLLEAKPVARTGLTSWLTEAARRNLLVLEKPTPGARLYSRIRVTAKGIKSLGKFPPAPPADFWLDGYGPGGKYRVPGQPVDTTPPVPPRLTAADVTAARAAVTWEPELPLEPVVAADPIDDTLALQKLALLLGDERDTWRHRYEQAEINIDDLVTRLGNAHEEITRLRKLIPEAVLVRLDNGEDPLDSSIQGRLTADAKAQLAALMAELNG